jgi:hypothetical protein
MAALTTWTTSADSAEYHFYRGHHRTDSLCPHLLRPSRILSCGWYSLPSRVTNVGTTTGEEEEELEADRYLRVWKVEDPPKGTTCARSLFPSTLVRPCSIL